VKDSATNPLSSDLPEPSFDQIQPRATGRDEVKVKAFMFAQPLLDIRMLVRPIIVHNQVEVHSRQCLTVNLAQKLQEFFMAMTRVTASDHRSIQHVESRKQRGRPIAFVVMGHRPATPLFHRQARLRSIKSLDLRFFVHAQHKRFIRRVQVKPHHIGQFLHKALVPGEFESLYPVRLKTMRIPDPRYGRMPYALRFAHCPSRPVGRSGRFSMQRGLDNAPDLVRRQTSVADSMRGILGEACHPLLLKTLPPQQNRRAGRPQLLCDAVVGDTLGCKEANPRPQNDSLRGGLSAYPGLQSLPLFRTHWQRLFWLPHESHYGIKRNHCQDIIETLH